MDAVLIDLVNNDLGNLCKGLNLLHRHHMTTLAQSRSCIEPCLAFATRTSSKHERIVWLERYRKLIECLCIVVWHVRVSAYLLEVTWLECAPWPVMKHMLADMLSTGIHTSVNILKLHSHLFAVWLFRTFHNKSHNMKALIILNHSWSPFLPYIFILKKSNLDLLKLKYLWLSKSILWHEFAICNTWLLQEGLECLKLPSLFASWLFLTFHKKSHSMKALVILNQYWSRFREG